jgi:hypothetical protein
MEAELSAATLLLLHQTTGRRISNFHDNLHCRTGTNEHTQVVLLLNFLFWRRRQKYLAKHLYLMIEAEDLSETLVSEDEDCWCLQNVGACLPDYTESQPRSPYCRAPGSYAVPLPQRPLVQASRDTPNPGRHCSEAGAAVRKRGRLRPDTHAHCVVT